MILIDVYDRLHGTNNRTASQLAHLCEMLPWHHCTPLSNLKGMTTRLLITPLSSSNISYRITVHITLSGVSDVATATSSECAPPDWKFRHMYHLIYHINQNHQSKKMKRFTKKEKIFHYGIKLSISFGIGDMPFVR